MLAAFFLHGAGKLRVKAHPGFLLFQTPRPGLLVAETAYVVAQPACLSQGVHPIFIGAGKVFGCHLQRDRRQKGRGRKLKREASRRRNAHRHTVVRKRRRIHAAAGASVKGLQNALRGLKGIEDVVNVRTTEPLDEFRTGVHPDREPDRERRIAHRARRALNVIAATRKAHHLDAAARGSALKEHVAFDFAVDARLSQNFPDGNALEKIVARFRFCGLADARDAKLSVAVLARDDFFRSASAHKRFREHRAVTGLVPAQTLGFGQFAVFALFQGFAAVVGHRVTRARAAGVGDLRCPAVFCDRHAVDNLRAARFRAHFCGLATDVVGSQCRTRIDLDYPRDLIA